MKSSGGYIKLWRQIRESPVWVDDGALKLWIDLLMRVTTKPRKTVLKIGREPVVVELEAGQCAVRERLLAQDLRMSRNKLRRLIALLVRLECITVSPTSKCVLVTIPNWAKYQQSQIDSGSKTEPPSPNGGAVIEPGSEPPSEPPSEPHNKKTKKTKKYVCDNPPSVQEVAAYGKEIGFDLDADYFVSKNTDDGWMQGRKDNRRPVTNWKLLVRTWQHNEKRNGYAKSAGANGRHQPASPPKPPLTRNFK